jgi:acetyltransferase-like isoleucine patch superfamily enzyme
VLTAARCFIGDTYHGYQDVTRPVIDQPMADPEKVTIGDGAFLGIGSVVLMGVTVGTNAYVAAGSVVTADVPPRTLVAGNPARPRRRWDDEQGSWVAV